MNPYGIEWIVEDALAELLGTECGGVKVYKGITDTFDGDGNPIILAESHIACYVSQLVRESPKNFNWNADCVVTVATWQDEDPSVSIRELHRLRCLAVRDILWQDDLNKQLTTGQLQVSGHLIGNVEIDVVGRHHVTRHRLLLRFVAVLDETP